MMEKTDRVEKVKTALAAVADVWPRTTENQKFRLCQLLAARAALTTPELVLQFDPCDGNGGIDHSRAPERFVLRGGQLVPCSENLSPIRV